MSERGAATLVVPAYTEENSETSAAHLEHTRRMTQRIPFTPLREYRCVVNLRGRAVGRAVWIRYKDAALEDGDFTEIGATFQESKVRKGQLGGTTAMLFSIKDAVDRAAAWMTENRR